MRFDENLYQSLFETASEAMFLLRDGQCVHCNVSGENLLNYQRDEIIGKMFSDFTALYQPDRQESAPMLLEKEQLALAGDEQIFNLMLETKDGAPIYTRASFNALRVGGTSFIRVSLQEISGEIKLAKELETVEAQRLERRRRQIQLATQVNQAIAGAVSLYDLYQRVVSQIKEQFHYYHVQLLRYDAVTQNAVLVAGYGDIGEEMLAQSRRIPLEKSLIGEAIFSGQSVLRTDLLSEPSWRADPLLPDTEAELIVPIKLGDEILGVLDVQSDVAGLLDADDQLMLEEVCGQVAIAIERTILRQEMEAKLQELKTLQQLTTLEGWRDFTTQKTQSTLGYTFRHGNINPIADSATDESPTNKNIVTHPMNIHGYNVGEVGIFYDPNTPLTDEEKSLLTDVGTQVTQALERARLFEQTRHQAAELRHSLTEAETLYRASRTIGEALSIEEIVRGAGQLAFSLNMSICTITRFNKFDETGMPTHGDLYSVQIQKDKLIATPSLNDIEIWDTEAARQSVDNPKMVIVYRDTEDPAENISAAMKGYMRGMKLRGGILLGLYARGKPIGLLSYYSVRPLVNVSENYIRQMRTVADQVVIAIENQQLLLEAQSRAQREQLSHEIGAKLSRSVDVDVILRTALKELSLALSATHGIIHLGIPEITKDTIIGTEFIPVNVTFPRTWETLMSTARAYLYSRSDDKFHDILGQWRQEMLSVFEQNAQVTYIGDGTTRLKSAVAVPILSAGQILGVIDIYDENVLRRWSVDDYALLENVAAQVGLSLDNARLFVDKQNALDDLEEQARRPRVLNEMYQVLNHINDEQTIFNTAIDYIKDIVWADDVKIFDFNQSTNRLSLNASYANLDDLPDEMMEYDVSDTLLGSVLMQNQQQINPRENLPGTVYVEIIADAIASTWKDIQHQAKRGLQSIMVAPILSHGRVIGVLNVAALQKNAYHTRDESFLVQIALLLSTVIENRRLLKQTERALLNTEKLYKTSQKLNAADSLQEILRVLLEAFPIPDINRALSMTISKDNLLNTETFKVLANWHSGKGPAPIPLDTEFSYKPEQSLKILSQKKAQFIADTQNDENLDEATKTWAKEHQIGAMAILPLQMLQRHFGVLLLQSENVHHFSPQETRPYLSIASRVATVLENQQLLAQSKAALSELEETQQRYTQQAWEFYRNTHSKLNHLKVKSGHVAIPPLPKEAIKNVVQNRKPIIRHQTEKDTETTAAELIMPLMWRDVVTGVLAVQDEMGKPRQWLSEEIELVQSIVNEFVQIADSLRLLDETQRRAAREKRINDINDKIQRAQSMEEALRIAVKEVGLSLTAPQTSIQLSVEAEE